MVQYINFSLFDTIPTTICNITTTKLGGKKQEIVFETSKFILNVPLCSGKSTELMIRINETKDNNYTFVVPTTNIANDFLKHLKSIIDRIKCNINFGIYIKHYMHIIIYPIQ